MRRVLTVRDGGDDASSTTDEMSLTEAAGSYQTKVVRVRQLCDDIESSLPDNYVTADVRSRLQRLGALHPMNAFLRAEIDRMQAVISAVGQSVRSLRQFVDGHWPYDDAVIAAFDAVHDAAVPPAWTQVDIVIVND